MTTNGSIAHLQLKVDEVTTVMHENVQFALKNTDKIEDIEKKSELLATSADTFRRTGSQLKHAMCVKHWKRIVQGAIIISILALLLYLLFN